MSRRLRPQGVSNFSSSIPDELDYEKIENRPRDNAVLAGCGATPRISLDEVSQSSITEQASQKKHHRATSSFSFGRNLHLDTATAPSHSEPPAAHPETDDITSPHETYTLVDLEKNLPSNQKESLVSIRPVPRATTTKAKSKVDREIWKMLLLNMYPITYLILWLPGIANRIAEGMGYEVRALVIMQSSTQFIGLANAGVYFYKEHRRDVREWWGGIRQRRIATGGTDNERGEQESSRRAWG